MRSRTNGVSKGWNDNYFLEFAPNVKKMATMDNALGGGPPMTKERLLQEFWKDLGVEEEEAGFVNRKSINEIVPEAWEVRARLRDMIQKNEDKKETELLKSLEHPILVKGEVDQKLKTKAERSRVHKKRKMDKEKEYLEMANATLNKDSGRKNEKSKEVNKVTKVAFKTSSHNYHRKAAPSRFYGGAKK
jgi:hypothetical protein